jgi:hypothetical protein
MKLKVTRWMLKANNREEAFVMKEAKALRGLLCYMELTGGSCSGLVTCFCCQYQLVHFSSDPVFFSDSKGFWPWYITV